MNLYDQYINYYSLKTLLKRYNSSHYVLKTGALYFVTPEEKNNYDYCCCCLIFIFYNTEWDFQSIIIIIRYPYARQKNLCKPGIDFPW